MNKIHFSLVKNKQKEVIYVEKECVSQNAIYEIRPCLVEDRKALFHGFCDNYDKCVVEYEDGELHKAYVWRVKFLDNKLKDYSFGESK